MLVTSHGREGEEVLWKLSYKDMNPIHEGPTLLTEPLPMATHTNTSYPRCRLGFQHSNSGDTHIQLMVHCLLAFIT